MTALGAIFFWLAKAIIFLLLILIFLFGRNLFGLKLGEGRYIQPRAEAAKPSFL